MSFAQGYVRRPFTARPLGQTRGVHTEARHREQVALSLHIVNTVDLRRFSVSMRLFLDRLNIAA